MYKKLIFAFVYLALIFLAAANVNADELNSTDFDDLANDISLTEPNQTLTLQKDYKLESASQKHIVIDKPMTIDGNDYTIDAPDVSRVFWVKADNVCIKNVNFINSKSGGLAGGVISWWGNNGTLTNCSFTNNSAVSAGGAVLWKGNDGVISNCTFKDNKVTYGTAVSLTEGDGYDKSQMIIAQVNSEGGALYLSGDNILVDCCNFINNRAALNGGAISANWPQNLTVSNSRFKANNCPYNGGAIDLNAVSATLINMTLEDNLPNDLFNNCQNTRIVNTTFKDPSSIVSWYDMTLVNVSFRDLGYFDELSAKINATPEGGILVLDKDYVYLNGSNKGIIISKSITINGNGHTLDGNNISRIFNITADNVVLRNINFINGNAWGRYFSNNIGGGAIYWYGANGRVENSNFTNNCGRGIEDDPFDSEETIIGDDGMIIHTIRIRPMGAKVNEGGAIVWNGTNGTVSGCVFRDNEVGYPNTGGAICWRGNDGLIIDSVFLDNGAWCGSAIAWVGDNGRILNSLVANCSFIDGGIYWFGHNGLIKNSILLASNDRPVLRSMGDVVADYNFWGDTIENPNGATKIDNVSCWLVIRFTHNGEFIEKGQNVLIKYDIITLVDKNGRLSEYDALIDKSGQIIYTAEKTGFLNITVSNGKINVRVDAKETIQSKDMVKYYAKKVMFKVKVYDLFGKVVGKVVKFKINGEVYEVKTDKNAVATLKLKLKPGKYKINTYYGDVKVKNKITIKSTLKTKNLSKKVKKSAKFNVKVLNSKGKAFKNQIVKIKFKGKAYKIKTNKKGIATFKVPDNLKAGKYKIKTTYNGLSNVNKIVVKK